MGEKVLETGIFLPGGSAKAAFTVRNDMAEAAANILLENGHENAVYLTATNETNSFADIAAILSDLSGKQIHYTDPGTGVFIETLTNAGVPAEIVGMTAGFSQAIKEGEFFFENNDLENLLKRKPVSLKEFLASVYTPAT
jgi:NAD(P)H dehydrogenase (quinone)